MMNWISRSFVFSDIKWGPTKELCLLLNFRWNWCWIGVQPRRVERCPIPPCAPWTPTTKRWVWPKCPKHRPTIQRGQVSVPWPPTLLCAATVCLHLRQQELIVVAVISIMHWPWSPINWRGSNVNMIKKPLENSPFFDNEKSQLYSR